MTPRSIALGVLSTVAAFGQAPTAKLEFEVASVRPSPEQGPGARVDVGFHLDGSQVRIASLPVRDYIAMAYKVKTYQITGPDRISDRFDLNAKLPAGSTSDQVPEMVLAFLTDRFGLKAHHDQKELPVYALILGKTPLKLVKSAPSADDGAKGTVNVAGSGSADGVSINLGNGSSYTFADNKFEIKKFDMTTLAAMLERFLDRPLLNLTGIDGQYDLTLPVTEDDYRTLLIRAGVNSGVVLPPQALQRLETGSIASLLDSMEKLGLKLDARKAPLDMIVVDQILKAPTDN